LQKIDLSAGRMRQSCQFLDEEALSRRGYAGEEYEA
jgi:hypothetical protein